ncbi:hypothetical protein PPYR_00592 [Photinus pyralis]|uniref:Gustatory receptor n=2 Tax=Photinus pyralis TaxID=7054 RepID=A0A5N4B1Z9_PHOPY|nr:uncharacterized protein LOC116158795 [Photinus pyralis]XP_031337838.1 uncharacterized protein LOC116166821 [Photinus pyralis]KAB0803622.1 hypothetical protein PPYR_00592 [Photinus pyralis]
MGLYNLKVLEKMQKRRCLRQTYYQMLYKSIEPVIIFCRIVGFLPTLEKKSKEEKIVKTTNKDWVLFVIYLTSYLTILLYNLKVLINKEIAFYISRRMQIVYLSISGLYTLGLIVFGYTERRVVNLCINRISEVDNFLKLAELGIVYEDVQVKLRRTFFIILTLTGFRTLFFSLVVEIYFLQHVCIFFNLILKLAFVFTFTMFAELVSYRFELINNTLRSYLNRHVDIHNTSSYIEKLYILCRSHFKLCKVVVKLTSSYGYQLLITGVALIANFVSVFYLLYSFWNRNSGEIIKLVAISFWFLTEAYELYGMVSKCSQASDDANELPITLHELQDEVNSTEIEDHIQMYSLKMLHQKLCFSALEFFDFDFSLLFAIMGSVLTFLVIVLQLEQLEQVENSLGIVVTEFVNKSIIATTTMSDDIVEGDYYDYDDY